jgi:uncharacterized protein DUF6058
MDIGAVTTPADIAYARSEFATLPELARPGIAIERMQAWAGTVLPRATYVLPDGELRYARDWWRMLDEAGSIDRVRSEFDRRLGEAMHALDHRLDPAEEWQSYLDGLYGVCLRDVTPENVVAKERLVARLDRMIATPRPGDAAWLEQLRADVDALDALIKSFAECDRVRWGSTSRLRLVTTVRATYLAG